MLNTPSLHFIKPMFETANDFVLNKLKIYPENPGLTQVSCLCAKALEWNPSSSASQKLEKLYKNLSDENVLLMKSIIQQRYEERIVADANKNVHEPLTCNNNQKFNEVVTGSTNNGQNL